MQQHLMQMQPMMAAYYSNSNVTTDHIQQYLDENKSLILKIVESQNSGKLSECAENQARLQRNLMYLAAIADSQPQPPSMHSQYPQNGIMQPAGHYMQQQQQAQSMTPQAMMAARSSMLYNQQPYAALQQSQPLHGQFSISSGSSGGLTMLQADHNNTAAGGSPYLHDFGRDTSGAVGMLGIGRVLGKQDIASSSSSDGHGHDGSESLYLKSTEDDGN